MLVNFDAQQGHSVHQGIECTQRANPLAKGSEYQYAQNNHHNQNYEFSGKQRTQRRANVLIHRSQRNCTLKHTLRTDIFAEKRVPHSQIVHCQSRQQNYGKQQYDVLQIGQWF